MIVHTRSVQCADVIIIIVIIIIIVHTRSVQCADVIAIIIIIIIIVHTRSVQCADVHDIRFPEARFCLGGDVESVGVVRLQSRDSCAERGRIVNFWV